jgi:CubicO group peptidase (beta-lactamase class C family)
LPSQRRAYAVQALRAAPKGPAETTFLYSNSGYVVAGAMLEAKTGQSWEDLMRAMLFAPLGMAGAGFGPPPSGDGLSEPLGHSKAWFGEGRTPHRPGRGVADNPAALGPAGTVHARPSDMLAYLAAHRDRPAFLTPASWDRLHSPPFGGDYALGLTRNGAGQLWHNGSNTFWYAEALIDAGANAGVAFAAANDGHLPKAEPAVSAALSGAIAAVERP